MNMKFSRSHFRLQALYKPVSPCGQDRRFRVLKQEEIQGMATEGNSSFSLKVCALSYGIAMKIYTGSADSVEAQALLEVCRDEVAWRLRIEIR